MISQRVEPHRAGFDMEALSIPSAGGMSSASPVSPKNGELFSTRHLFRIASRTAPINCSPA